MSGVCRGQGRAAACGRGPPKHQDANGAERTRAPALESITDQQGTCHFSAVLER